MKTIKIVNEYLGFKKEDDWQYNEWKSTLKYGGKQMTVPFKMSVGLSGEPDVKDVMSALIMDRSITQYTQSFEDFCAEMGYDPDSRKAEKIYNQILKQSEKLEKFLGDDLATFEKKFEDY